MATKVTPRIKLHKVHTITLINVKAVVESVIT